MQIFTAEHSGFCEGVERAFGIAVEASKAGQPVYMLGNLVHNKQVVERLSNFGIRSVPSLSDIPKNTRGILLISAHGVVPEIYQQARALDLEIIDTTCPWVKKAQRIAQELAHEGRTVIIVGDKGHPEVKGLVGWSKGAALVIENLEDLKKLAIKPEEKVGILAQTTQAEEHFRALADALKTLVKDVKEYDTICGATNKRQNAAVLLARKVDLILVIGDSLSANTKRLAELCSKTGTETHQLQTVAELDHNWLTGKEKVGVTAGASTPEWIINEVIADLETR